MIAALACLAVILALELLTPFWWWIMAVPFVYGAAAARTGWRAFRTGLLAAGLLWLGASLWLYLNGSRLIASRMATVIGLRSGVLMVALTGLAGALAAGLAGYAGYAIGTLFKSGKKAAGPSGKERT